MQSLTTLAFASPLVAASSNSLSRTTFCARQQARGRVLPGIPRPARIHPVATAAPPPPPNDEAPDAAAEAQTDPVETSESEESTAPADAPEEVTADDILNSPIFLKRKLEVVQKELIEAKEAREKQEEAVEEEKQRYVRLAADFENYRRRSLDDLRKQDAKSTAAVCKQILDVLDNFERATKAVNAETEKEKAISNSYQAINRQLLDALAKLNVEPIDAVGTPFDPTEHEAIQRMESTEHKEDVVCAQFSRGYKIGDMLVRAAVVAVSTGPGPEGEEGEEGEEEEEEALDVEAADAAEEEGK